MNKEILKFGIYKFHYPPKAEFHSFGVVFNHFACEWYVTIYFWKRQYDIGYMFFDVEQHMTGEQR